MRHVVVLVAAALIIGGAQAETAKAGIFNFGGLTADAFDEDDFPFAVEDLHEGVLARFNWYDTDTFEELVDENAVTLSGVTLVNTHPFENVQDGLVRSLYMGSAGAYAVVEPGELTEAEDEVTLSVHVMRTSTTDLGVIAYAQLGFMLYTNQNGHLILSVRTGSSWTDVVADSYNHLPLNQWHELRGVYDGNYIYLYVDNRLVGVEPATGSMNIRTDGALWLGGLIHSSYAFRGYITGLVVSSEPIHPRARALPRSRWDFEGSDAQTLTSVLTFPYPSHGGTITDDGDIDGPTWDTSGDPSPGRALVFTQASDRITAGTHATAVSSHGVSASAWINLDTQVPSNDQFIVRKGFAFNMRVTNSRRLYCRARDALGAWLTAEAPSEWAMATEEWHHIACTYDGAKLKGYVNGKLAVVTSGGRGYYGGMDVVYVGNNDGNNALKGKLADVAIADGPVEKFRAPTEQYSRYDFLDDQQSSLPSLVDGFGEITLQGQVSWSSDGPPGVREKSLAVQASGGSWSSGGRLEVDGRVLRGVPEFVLSTWLRLDEMPTMVADIIERDDQFRLRLRPDGTLIWAVEVTHPSGVTATVEADGESYPLQQGKWHHVSMRWRSDGATWRAQLNIDSVPVASAAANADFVRETDNSSTIVFGPLKGGLTGPVTTPDWICAHCELTEEPGLVYDCDPDDALAIHQTRIFPTGLSGAPIIRYFYATDSQWNRCVTNHPILLIQGMGQQPESWYACNVTALGDWTSSGGWHSIAAPKSFCDPVSGSDLDSLYTDSTALWCPSVVEALVRRGAEVITVDFRSAQLDINSAQPKIAWAKEWLRPGGTDDAPGPCASPPNCDYWEFKDYPARGKRVKGGDDEAEGWGRFSHPLDNAYVVGLLAEYFYREQGGFATQFDEDYVPGRKLILVGHSAGGVTANWATVGRSWGQRDVHHDQQYDGHWLGIDAWPYIEKVVTLGSPHRGSRLIDFGLAVNQASWATDSTGLTAVFKESPLVHGSLKNTIKTALWHSFKAWESINASYPVVHALAPALWDPQSGTSYRTLIDERIVDLSSTETMPAHYQIAGLYNAIKTDEGQECIRTPADEVDRSQYYGKKYWVVHGRAHRIVETTVPFAFDFEWLEDWGNADERNCQKFGDQVTGISSECTEEQNQIFSCAGNINIGIGWRLLTQTGGDIRLTKIPEDRYTGPYVMGSLTSSFWVNGAISAEVDAPGQYGFGDSSISDGAVTQEEALGLPGAYGVVVRGLNSPACQTPFEDGVPRNHHQLRAAVMFSDTFICDPDVSPGCAEMKLSDLLLQ